MLRRIGDPRVSWRMPSAVSSDGLTTNAMIDYHVPKPDVFQRFAQQVGDQMAELYADPRYAEQAAVDGLANFLKVVCELTVKRLNSVSKV